MLSQAQCPVAACCLRGAEAVPLHTDPSCAGHPAAPLQSVGPDFSNYDENAAWPYLIDDWVSEMRKQQANGGA